MFISGRVCLKQSEQVKRLHDGDLVYLKKTRSTTNGVGKVCLQIWADFKAVVGSRKCSGKTGQVRKAFFGSRSITLLGTKLNRGSVIDFINSVIEKDPTEFLGLNTLLGLDPRTDIVLNKGNFLFGGSSDAHINTVFEAVCEKLDKKAISLENLGEKQIGRVDARWR